jgi:hypothetical protein
MYVGQIMHDENIVLTAPTGTTVRGIVHIRSVAPTPLVLVPMLMAPTLLASRLATEFGGA